MENRSEQEKAFDSFLNKTIILSSKKYFVRQMTTIERENTILDNEDFSAFVQEATNINGHFSSIDDVDTSMQLNTALNCLSDIEKAVIFLLFEKELSQKEAARILEIYSKTVSKIKIRAIEKLRKYLEGDVGDEE